VIPRDPRVYFAAERTLLAWVRSGVAVIGLGFVVSRFGLFLSLVNPHHPDLTRMSFSGVVGSVLSITGGLVTALAALQFRSFLRELLPEELPRTRLTAPLGVALALAVSSVGVVLGVYLLS
jgi:putative membrane protein